MVEGEGSITLGGKVAGKFMSIGKKTMERLEKATGLYPKELSVYSSDPEIIATCLRLTGVGSVYYRPPRPDYVSPRGRQAFAVKDGWQWTVKSATQMRQLLPQLYHYFTSEKRLLAMLSMPIRGHSCHPTHFEAPRLPGKTDEEVDRAWAAHKKDDEIDPRGQKNKARWKAGHEPGFDEPESGWVYAKVEFDGEPTEPDQLDLLHGGPPVNMDCERCGTQLHLVGQMTQWEIMTQAGVSIANLEDIDSARKKVLQDEIIAILACPECRKKYQFMMDMVPHV